MFRRREVSLEGQQTRTGKGSQFLQKSIILMCNQIVSSEFFGIDRLWLTSSINSKAVIKNSISNN